MIVAHEKRLIAPISPFFGSICLSDSVSPHYLTVRSVNAVRIDENTCPFETSPKYFSVIEQGACFHSSSDS
jgi:hypothetical protein